MTATWAAILIFYSSEACNQYVEENNLIQQFDMQCIIIEEPGFAPTKSIRPKARKKSHGSK